MAASPSGCVKLTETAQWKMCVIFMTEHIFSVYLADMPTSGHATSPSMTFASNNCFASLDKNENVSAESNLSMRSIAEQPCLDVHTITMPPRIANSSEYLSKYWSKSEPRNPVAP
eukprot:15341203-Ditylum_brightwellii.AAC.1